MITKIWKETAVAAGFSDRFDFAPIIGWELEQVTIDKYHVMFWFQGDSALLNVADRFSFRSSDGLLNYSYEIYGSRKTLNVDRILRIKIADVRIITKNQLDLVFENRDVLSIYDNPELRSWWFYGERQNDPRVQRTTWLLQIDDLEPGDLTDQEYRTRRA